MYVFIYWIKAIAAILITNSHYGGIWPVSAMAFGGMLGNCLFFATAGFLLWNLKEPFPLWYCKRILRIYPVFWMAVLLDLAAGRYAVKDLQDIIDYFIYPTTWFHFIASIIVLYVVFYFLAYVSQKHCVDIRWIIAGVFIVYLAIYIFLYDKSYYHIDFVEERMVRFLFLECMLLGGLLRERIQSGMETAENRRGNAVKVFVLLIVYVLSKLMFDRYDSISGFQILNQIILYILVYQIFVLAEDMELHGSRLEKVPVIPAVVRFLAALTLEIYVGQYLVIYLLPETRFPISFVLTTGAIVLYAWLLHMAGSFVGKRLMSKMNKQGETGV